MLHSISPTRDLFAQIPETLLLPAYVAFLHGPIVLAARTGTEDLAGLVADDSRWGQIAGGKRLPLEKAPLIIEDEMSRLSDALVPVEGTSLTFRVPGLRMINPLMVVLEPFFQIHDAR